MLAAVHRILAGTLVAAVLSCGGQRPPTLDRLRQPTGLQLSPDGRWAFVTNGNWDASESGGGVLVLDLERLHAALEGEANPADPTRQEPCRMRGDRLSCSAEHMVVPEANHRLGSAVGNLVLDRPSGDAGAARLITVQRSPAAIVWFSVMTGADGPVLDCGEDFDGACDEVHTLTQLADRPADGSLPDDPSRVVLDDQGYRFAYVPHLVDGALSLLALDGEAGPEIVDIVSDFYRDDPFEATDYAGGFGVASRPCDPSAAPSGSRDCTRPVLYATQRYFPSVRRFAVAPGLDVVVPGGEASLAVVNPEVVASVPYMGDLAFADPRAGTDLLVVQTSPGALLRVDTAPGSDGDPADTVLGAVPLCEQPNLLAVHRPEGGEALALVTCFGEGRLAVVGLGGFRLLKTLDLGEGANEIVIDAARQIALVVNTRDDSISVVGLDRSDATFLTEVARIE
jgi:hypothetical protein